MASTICFSVDGASTESHMSYYSNVVLGTQPLVYCGSAQSPGVWATHEGQGSIDWNSSIFEGDDHSAFLLSVKEPTKLKQAVQYKIGDSKRAPYCGGVLRSTRVPNEKDEIVSATLQLPKKPP
ncbi:hypothetical protein TIFTF001_006736 [Ficus carica]|uniref:Uncharacterized protein n=1 Tax=Ficus carica TaxID=3494 RepID=A0AA88D034_FICCA|nr:hypothetical protein TIFTF001_006736 [Ficus carica]